MIQKPPVRKYAVNFGKMTFAGMNNMTLLRMCVIITAVFLLYCVPTNAKELTDIETCILEIFQTSPDELTIGEAKAQCRDKVVTTRKTYSDDKSLKKSGIVEERLNADDKNILKPFTLMAHKSNYILLAAHNFQGWNSEIHEQISNLDSIEFQDTEVQFQLSLKTPIVVDLFDEGVDIFGAYTVRSFWQLYNDNISSPFRETNHEPEIWIQARPDIAFLGFKHNARALGFSHQSNGQGGSLSRSWNRIYALFGFERGNFAFMLKPWFRIPEDIENDDNPDITDYLGHAELQMAYKYNDHTFTLMTRNNLESGFSRGTVALGWSFPLFQYKYFKGYMHYFSGYGMSLIDYDQYVNQIGFGLVFTDPI